MKIGISGDHCAFFEKYGYISFEAVLSKPESVFLELASFAQPRDICRQSQLMRTKLMSSNVPEVASQLLKGVSLRYGFDCLFSSKTLPCTHGAIEDCFCVTPLSLIILIVGSPGTYEPHTMTPFHMTYKDLPVHPGDIVCINPAVTWDMTYAQEEAYRLFWCVGFSGPSLTYIWNTNDPYCHLLKRDGYIPNESLQERTHPFYT